MKFGLGMVRDDPKVDLEGQGHRSKVKVTRSEIVILGLCSLTGNEMKVKVTWVKVRGHLGQGQGSLGLRSKVTLVKILAGGLTSTSSCIFRSCRFLVVCWRPHPAGT